MENKTESEKCKHENKTKNTDPSSSSNLTGEYFEWTCNDCGYKKREGRSYAHKEICEYAQMLKICAKNKSSKKSIKCLELIRDMAIDALGRLGSETGIDYYENVF